LSRRRRSAQRGAIRVAYTHRHLVDAGIGRFQKVHRALHPQALEAGERRLPKHALSAAGERPFARSDNPRRFAEGKSARDS
jgi:hypothetical protein